MKTKARMRAVVQLRENPSGTAASVESLDAATPVEVLEDQGAWLKIKAGRTGSVPGWVPREALAFPPADNKIFPDCTPESGRSFPSVPLSLKAADLANWLAAPGVPGWIPSGKWSQVRADDQQTILDGIQSAIQQRQADWDAWQSRLSAEGRQADARIAEWLCLQNQGMDVWTLRGERIFNEPSEQKGKVLGWAVENDILNWTGQVRRNDKEPKYKIWYEVCVYKQNKMLSGWFKGDLLDPYILPSDENDPAVDGNKDSQFDLQRPILSRPADAEIGDAVAAQRTGFQYIDIVRVIGRTKIHHNLCGEFCVAALAGRDLIPILQEWLPVHPRAKEILNNDQGTGLSDIKVMLNLCNLGFEEYRYSPSVSPVSPIRMRAELERGRMAFAGVGIFKSNGRLSGTVTDEKKTTRHWVVLEDVVPVGNNGWVRIYNPFRNQEEVYPYKLFIESHGQLPIGLWVTPKLPA